MAVILPVPMPPGNVNVTAARRSEDRKPLFAIDWHRPASLRAMTPALRHRRDGGMRQYSKSRRFAMKHSLFIFAASMFAHAMAEMM